jgi:hypothetical protein
LAGVDSVSEEVRDLFTRSCGFDVHLGRRGYRKMRALNDRRGGNFHMNVAIDPMRKGVVIAAMVAGLVVTAKPSVAVANNIYEIDGEICGSGQTTLGSAQSNDVTEEEI